MIYGRSEVEVASMIAKPFWRAPVSYGFSQLGIDSLIALIDPAHEASIRTARSAGLAFDFETEIDGLPTLIYRIRIGNCEDEG